jgi:hypothetical protein
VCRSGTMSRDPHSIEPRVSIIIPTHDRPGMLMDAPVLSSARPIPHGNVLSSMTQERSTYLLSTTRECVFSALRPPAGPGLLAIGDFGLRPGNTSAFSMTTTGSRARRSRSLSLPPGRGDRLRPVDLHGITANRPTAQLLRLASGYADRPPSATLDRNLLT